MGVEWEWLQEGQVGAFQSVVDVNDRVGQKERIMVTGAGVSPLRRPAVASSCLEGVTGLQGTKSCSGNINGLIEGVGFIKHLSLECLSGFAVSPSRASLKAVLFFSSQRFFQETDHPKDLSGETASSR